MKTTEHDYAALECIKQHRQLLRDRILRYIVESQEPFARPSDWFAIPHFTTGKLRVITLGRLRRLASLGLVRVDWHNYELSLPPQPSTEL